MNTMLSIYPDLIDLRTDLIRMIEYPDNIFQEFKMKYMSDIDIDRESLFVFFMLINDPIDDTVKMLGIDDMSLDFIHNKLCELQSDISSFFKDIKEVDYDGI